ncbi:MAG: dTDP-4-dehydrorhamnose reductase [Bacteroidales bacterium]|nr:dTDP-4-dehydrorhamnose reductase [Bacteroidales bacterium]
MNILVTGANGQLGNEMRIISRESTDKYIFTDVNQVEGLETTYLDITDLDAIRKMVAENDVNAIVNCAAWTNVDGAEDPEKYELVEKLNATAPENLAIAMKEVGGWLVQISTDYVFGKEPYNTPCKEDQKGTPTGVYGMTKLMGEQKIISVMSGTQNAGGYIIIRTAWLYSEFGKNFCKTMLNLTATKPQLKVVFDQCGTPTYAWDLATAIVAALKNPVAGVYHYSNEGVTSWYDFTKMIQQIALEVGYYKESLCDIQPCHSNEFPSPVTRPSYSVLDKTKIKETFGIKVPYWTDSLKTCIKNLNS